MSRARDIILEVRRLTGDTNAASPDEADELAFLNAALRGIWSYGIELDSPRIEETEYAMCRPDGKAALKKRPVKVTSVYDTRAQRYLRRIAPRETVPARRFFGWRETADGIALHVPPRFPGALLYVTYYPEFEPLKGRDDELPFSSETDGITAAWTAALIKSKGNAPVGNADMLNAVGVPISTLVQYFEGHADEHFRGEGPW